MSIRIQQSIPDDHGGAVLITASGDLELHTVGEFARLTGQAPPAGDEGLVLDLCTLDFLDSSGLTALITLHDRVEAGGGKMAVVSSNRMINRRFDLTGLNGVLGVVRTRDQAFAAVNGGAVASS